MSKEQEEKIDKEELNTQNTSEETTDTAAEAQADAAAEEATEEETEGDNAQKSAEESLDDKINKLTEDLEKANKEYLFLLAEFDNFRKRTVREKADIIRNAGEKVLGQLLPIIDDFERAIKANEQARRYAHLQQTHKVPRTKSGESHRIDRLRLRHRAARSRNHIPRSKRGTQRQGHRHRYDRLHHQRQSATPCQSGGRTIIII